MIQSGHPRAQAVAAALDTARRYASGGSYLAGSAGSPVDLSKIGAYQAQTPASTGILPSGLMSVPQVGSFQIDPTTGALTASTQAALRALAMRGINLPPPASVNPDAAQQPQQPTVLLQEAGADRSGSKSGGFGGGIGSGEPGAAGFDAGPGMGDIASGGLYQRGGAAGEPEAEGDAPSGLIVSPIGGRSDQIPMHLASGSYVIPADVMSGIGQGNTMAGGHAFDAMIAAAPHRGALPLPKLTGEMQAPAGMPRMVARRHFARGGRMRGRVPVIVAGGERIVSPAEVARLSGGDVQKGHKMLDEWVVRARKHVTEHMKKLPGPVKS